MKRRFKKIKNISSAKAEVQNISNQGLWLLINGKEFFLPFTEFPWFLKATIEQIYKLDFFNNKHLHWPELDIDISIESLEYPEAYPLKYSC